MEVDIWDYIIVILWLTHVNLRNFEGGVAKGSITRINALLGKLEGEAHHPSTCDSARQILAKLKEHDTEFRKIHLTLIDNDETLIAEQATLDEHDDLVASLCALADSAHRSTSAKTISECDLVRRCDCFESRLMETDTALTCEDACQLEQHHEQLLDFRKEMSEINDKLLSLMLDESDALPARSTSLERKLFDCSLRHKELSHSSTTSI